MAQDGVSVVPSPMQSLLMQAQADKLKAQLRERRSGSPLGKQYVPVNAAYALSDTLTIPAAHVSLPLALAGSGAGSV